MTEIPDEDTSAMVLQERVDDRVAALGWRGTCDWICDRFGRADEVLDALAKMAKDAEEAVETLKDWEESRPLNPQQRKERGRAQHVLSVLYGALHAVLEDNDLHDFPIAAWPKEYVREVPEPWRVRTKVELMNAKGDPAEYWPFTLINGAREDCARMVELLIEKECALGRSGGCNVISRLEDLARAIRGMP